LTFSNKIEVIPIRPRRGSEPMIGLLG
jgi:hypothetical protein